MKLIPLLVLTSLGWAQEAPAVAPRPVTRVFEFVLDDAEKIQRLAELFGNRLQRAKVDPALGLVVLTGAEADVVEAEAAIKRYYKPKALEAAISGPPNRNFELVLHVLHARQEGTESLAPPSLQPVIQQLKQLTNLTSFRTVESQVLRVRSGEKAEVTGVLQSAEYPEKVASQYQFRIAVRPSGVKIRCDDLRFSARLPYAVGPDLHQFRELLFFTAVDLKPGQATVIGKANASAKDGAIILVLTANFVD